MITHVTTCGRYGMSVLLALVITYCCTLHLLLINYLRDNPHKSFALACIIFPIVRARDMSDLQDMAIPG
jgi:hypothetical protein